MPESLKETRVRRGFVAAPKRKQFKRPMQSIKYEGSIPDKLRMYCDRHRHQIAAVNAGGGYATDDGFSYDVMLRDGWKDGSDAMGSCHTVMNTTLKGILIALRGVLPCDCTDCTAAKDHSPNLRHAQKSASDTLEETK